MVWLSFPFWYFKGGNFQRSIFYLIKTVKMLIGGSSNENYPCLIEIQTTTVNVVTDSSRYTKLMIAATESIQATLSLRQLKYRSHKLPDRLFSSFFKE